MHRRHVSRIGAIVATTVVFALAVPTTAFAGTYRSIYQASWFAGPPGIKQAKAVTAQFVLPKLKCKSTELSGIAAGVSIWDGSHVGSTVVASVYVDLHCVHGKVTYEPWFDVNGKWTAAKVSVKQGDTVQAVALQATTGTTLVLDDVTTKKTATHRGPGAHAATYATVAMNWMERPKTTVPLPVPNFGHVTFDKATVNGLPLGDYGLSKYEMYGGTKNPPPASAHLLVDVGAVTKKVSFTCTFKRSS